MARQDNIICHSEPCDNITDVLVTGWVSWVVQIGLIPHPDPQIQCLPSNSHGKHR